MEFHNTNVLDCKQIRLQEAYLVLVVLLVADYNLPSFFGFLDNFFDQNEEMFYFSYYFFVDGKPWKIIKFENSIVLNVMKNF